MGHKSVGKTLTFVKKSFETQASESISLRNSYFMEGFHLISCILEISFTCSNFLNIFMCYSYYLLVDQKSF